MKIRTKVFITTILFSIFIVFSLMIVSWIFLQKPFLKLEDEQAERNLKRIEVGLEQGIKNISSTTKDWSQWDDSYNYILDPNEDYINSNIYPNALARINVNFIALINNQNKIVFVYGTDIVAKEEKDFSKAVESIVSDSRFKPNVEIAGVAYAKDYNPIIFSSQPILKSDGSGPIAGSLIFGRFIDEGIIKNVTDMTIFPASIQKIDSNPDIELSNVVSALTTKNFFVVKKNSDTAYGYSLIKDVYGKNSFLAKIEIKRDIYKEGIILIKTIVLLASMGGILSIIVISLLFDRIVLRPLTKLEESVKKAIANADPNEIIDLGSQNEISFLASVIKKGFGDQSWIMEQVKRGEAEYRRIFELSPEAIVVLDNRGNLLDANGRIFDWLEYKKEDLLGKNLLKFPFFSAKTKLEVMKKFAQRMMGKKILTYDLEFIRKDGAIRVGRLNGTPIRDENNKIIKDLIMVTDVTEIKKIEEALKESEENYRRIFDEAHDGIFTMDTYGRFISGNKKAEKMIGYKKEEIFGKKFTQFLKGEERVRAFNIFKEVIFKKREEYVSLLNITRRDGTLLPIELKGNVLKKEGKIIGVLGIARDISERIKAERALKVANEKIEKEKIQDEAILESIAEGLIVSDSNENILFFNKGAEDLLGWRSEEVVGKSFLNIVKLENEKGRELLGEERPFRIALKNKKYFTGGIAEKYYYKRKDKTKFPVAMIVSPLIWEQKTTGIVIVFRDITKEKEIDLAKSEFVSLASHQLRTPLTTVNWYIEMLLQNEAGQLNQKQKKYLEDIYGASQRMTGLVGSLLNVARIELGTFLIEPKKANIEDIIESVLRELMPTIQKKKIEIGKNYESDIPTIYTDLKLTRVLFQNLISNAVKYTPEKGKVSIELTKRGNEKLLIQISDNGYGIPKKEQNKIFTKLYRAVNIRKIDSDGSGLGLYIAKGIVEAYGGKIWFESEENIGTTFSILIPIKVVKKSGTKKIE